MFKHHYPSYCMWKTWSLQRFPLLVVEKKYRKHPLGAVGHGQVCNFHWNLFTCKINSNAISFNSKWSIYKLELEDSMEFWILAFKLTFSINLNCMCLAKSSPAEVSHYTPLLPWYPQVPTYKYFYSQLLLKLIWLLSRTQVK